MGLEAPIQYDSRWPVVSLAEVTTKIGSGATPRGGAETYLPTRMHFAFVRSQNVFDRRFDSDGLAFISDEQADGLQGVALQPGDILLNITGDGITFGRACMVPERILPACVNQHVSIIRVDPQRAAPGYVLSFLTHPEVKPYIESFNAGGSRRAITKGHIQSFRLPLPPLPEQRAITHILSSLDDKIELNRRMNETLEAMARALFKSWFVDFDPVRAKAEGRQPGGMDVETAKLFPSEFEDSELGEIPKGWAAARLGNVLELKRGYDLPSAQRRRGIVPIISSSGPSGFHDEAKVRAPGIVTGRYGTIGEVFFVQEDFWPLNTTLYVRDFKGADVLYVAHLLRLVDFDKFSDKAAVPGINRNHVHEQRVVAPPPALQTRFGQVAGVWLNQQTRNGVQSRTLIKLRDTLLPSLVSGKLSVGGQGVDRVDKREHA